MIAATALSLTGPAHADPDWKAVGAALGKDGVLQPGGVYRVGLPRSDLKVVLDGVELKPAFALGSWRGEDLIPTGADQNPWAHWRRLMDMMIQGWSMSLFQA